MSPRYREAEYRQRGTGLKGMKGGQKTPILPKYNLNVYLLMNIYYTDEK